ncbi:MAG TPA: sugar ABC transporter permease, partial [Nitrospiraceae bacterium]|nr:sugar ABC transporter permease [Nitrospiraceae bacterium]
RLAITREGAYGLGFAAPAVIFLGLFSVYPTLYAAWLGLFRYDLLTTPQFIGLGNYLALVYDSLFGKALVHTGYYVLGSTILVVPAALAAALALNQPLRGRNWFRAIYFAPMMLPLFSLALMWKFIYQPYSLVNTLLKPLTHVTIPWLTDVDYAMPALILLRVWRGTGYYMLLFLAGLQTIPTEYYEVATIDGATPWQSFRALTWPLLKPTTLFVVVICLINAFQGFDTFLIMTNGGPADATTVLSLLIYRTGLQYYQMGLAAAMSIVMLAIIVVLTLAQFRALRYEV